MKIAIFHYHLKPGGVTDVIVFSVRAVLRHINRIEEVRLVTGDMEGTERVLDRIRQDLPHAARDKVKLDILNEIGYTESDVHPDVEKLIARLEARYGENTLWWIHNHHLGKNPSFTAALTKLASIGNHDMLFHIHDFPECGRPANLKRLRTFLDGPPYPSGPRVRYMTINERDRRILDNAGLGESVHLLPNPVPEPPLGHVDSIVLREALKEHCLPLNPGFLPDAPTLLYPVRTIRRKNVLEAGLIASLLQNPVNILVTLPGVSAQEAPYSDRVKQCFREGLIPGAWCPESTGDPRLTYPNLASGCDGVISTSIQEGFGFLFLNALYWKKPLLARYLDILDNALDLFGDYPRRFWADFRVPVNAETAERTQAAYLHKIQAIKSHIPDKSLNSMRVAAGRIVNAGTVDVSFLSVDDQITALKNAHESITWREETQSLNRELLDSMSRTLLATAPDMRSILISQFGDVAFVRRFSGVVKSLGKKLSTASPVKVQESVSKAFGRIDYIRLLYDF